MAVSSTGDVYAWGKTVGGRIGLDIPNSDHVSSPTQVMVGKNCDRIFRAVDVECGYVHSLIVGYDGMILMCGGVEIDCAEDGQLVDGNAQSLTGKFIFLHQVSIVPLKLSLKNVCNFWFSLSSGRPTFPSFRP